MRKRYVEKARQAATVSLLAAGESWGRMVHEFTSGNMTTLKQSSPYILCDGGSLLLCSSTLMCSHFLKKA